MIKLKATIYSCAAPKAMTRTRLEDKPDDYLINYGEMTPTEAPLIDEHVFISEIILVCCKIPLGCCRRVQVYTDRPINLLSKVSPALLDCDGIHEITGAGLFVMLRVNYNVIF